MRAVYDEIVLAPGGMDRADAWASRIGIGSTHDVQVAKKFRAIYANVHARGNSVNTIFLTLIPPPAADVDAAFGDLMLFWAGLPAQGDLVLSSGAYQVTYADAVKNPFQFTPRTGISNRYELSFSAGAPSALTTLSRLAQMDSRYIASLPDITTLTGGGATALDSLATTDRSVGFTVHLFATINGVTQGTHFRLIAGTAAENTDRSAGAVIVRPDDYDAETNAKVWAELG